MVSRADSRTFRASRRSVPVAVPAPPLARRSERFFFALSLVTFAIVMFYASMVTLTRVTPALFKGQNLDIPIVTDTVNLLPQQLQPEAPGEASSFNQRINLLVMGVDKRSTFAADGTEIGPADDAGPYNTDTLMVLTIDPVSKTISGLSFPRDMVITIHSKLGFDYEGRINASYADGFQNSGHSISAGAEQLASDITANFDIEIDRWVWMDFKDVEKLVDTIGGVTVNIPDDLQVPHDREASPWGWWYSDDDFTNPHYVEFGPGPVKLTGYEAVAFGRYREDSDLYRVKRQQLVLQASIGQLFTTTLLRQNPADLWDTYSDVVRHNIPFAEIAGLLPLLRETGGSMMLYSVGDPVNGVQTMENYTDPDTGAALLRWDPDNVQYWINQAFTRSRYAKSTVEIQSASGPLGIESSQRLAQYLLYEQFLPEVHLGIDVAIQPHTTIQLVTENRLPMAQDIADWLGIPHSEIVLKSRTSETQPDIIIIVGQGFDPSKLAPP